jgi:[ribosomal protein S5]-alanine N-acetyltransferase
MQGRNRLEKEFGLMQTDRVVSPDIKERVGFFILPEVKRAMPDNYIFWTFWIVIEKETKKIVAELGFKGLPNDNGEIEIGYSSFWDQRNKGIMTEAVHGMIRWAQTRSDIKHILAETNSQNFASIRVLQKNHFENYERKQEMLWWRVAINPNPIA